MSLQIEVGAVGDALELVELLAPEVAPVLDVDRSLGVVRELVLRVLVEAHVVRVQTQVDVEIPARLQPVLVPLDISTRLDEEFHLHLLELARPEDEVARRDLVAEGLTGLCNTERWLLARGGQDVAEVQEDALRGLRSQVGQAGLVLDRTEMRLEHPGELLRLCPGMPVTAVRTGDVIKAVLWLVTLLPLELFLEVVGAESLVAMGAFGERVAE